VLCRNSYQCVFISEFEWVRNPLAASVSGLKTCGYEQIIDISYDDSLKDRFDADKLPQFWLFCE
jgi:hypothetical protein